LELVLDGLLVSGEALLPAVRWLSLLHPKLTNARSISIHMLFFMWVPPGDSRDLDEKEKYGDGQEAEPPFF